MEIKLISQNIGLMELKLMEVATITISVAKQTPIFMVFFLEILMQNNPRTGNGFAGIITNAYGYNPICFPHYYVEGLVNKLKKSIITNNCYTTSFYIKFSGYFIKYWDLKNYACNTISVGFGSDSIFYNSPTNSENICIGG